MKILILFLVFGLVYPQITGPECLQPYCYCLNTVTLYCSNFTQFGQLDFRRTNGRIFQKVDLIPLTFLDLNENVNFNGLRLNGKLSLSNIRSINAFYNPFRMILHDRFDLAFFNSNFKFTNSLTPSLEENLLLDNCSMSQNNMNFVFSQLKLNEFVMCKVFFERPACPALFRNTQIKNMIITDPIGAFGFSKVYTPEFLNTFIQQLELAYSPDNTHPQFLDTENILNPDLFLYLERININSARRLAYIQEDTFKNLPSVKKLELNNVPLKNLLTYNRRWLRNLNYREKFYDIDYISLNSSNANQIFQLIIWVNDDWEFKDESDICLFKNFPHQKLVFPFMLFSKPQEQCTCTIYWLYKYFTKYQDIYNLNQNIVPYHCFTQSNWDRCKFNDLFNRYCPNEDPEEHYTTLKPSTGSLSYSTLTYSTQSWTSGDYFTSSYFQLIEDVVKDCKFSQAAFIMAIILCVVAVLIIIVLIILYYNVFKQKRDVVNRVQLNTEPMTSNQSEVKV